tara:strand:- start:2382 stop:3017 length:636 start_codon:yes stop_codon:yes gene_type:complete
MTATAEITELDFANWALSKGCKSAAIAAFSGGDLEEQVNAIYWTHTEALLATALWRFNTNTIQLTRLSATPVSKWDYKYALPSDRITDPIAIFDDADAAFAHQDFEIFEDELHCDDETCFVHYQRRPSSPRRWTPVFRDFALTSLAAELALQIVEDRSRYETFKIEAYGSLRPGGLGGKLLIAVQREALSAPPVSALPDGGPLVRARQGGG